MTRLVVLLPNWAPAVKSVRTAFKWRAMAGRVQRIKAICDIFILETCLPRHSFVWVFLFFKKKKPCMTCIADVIAVGSTAPELPSLSPVLQEVNRKRMQDLYFLGRRGLSAGAPCLPIYR
jgi:hypothetical protein